MLLKSDVTRCDHVVRCYGSQECWFTHRQFHSQFHSRRHSLCITLNYTTLVCMRSSNAWTTKPWQRSLWRLGFWVFTFLQIFSIHEIRKPWAMSILFPVLEKSEKVRKMPYFGMVDKIRNNFFFFSLCGEKTGQSGKILTHVMLGILHILAVWLILILQFTLI